jgi:uncharacterized protein (TIGR02453 family)
MAGFAGFSNDGLKFLKALKKNNRREWFQPRKEEYERLWRTPMIELVTALQAEAIKFAPGHVQDPAKAVLRIYRDTRFSKNKTPYKTYVAAALRSTGLSKDGSGVFYFHIDETGLFIAGGVYAPMPDELRALREYLAEHYEQFRKLTGAAKFKSLAGELHGEQLTRVPKGFDPEHPAADLLRRKQFYFDVQLGPEVVTSPAIYTELVKRFKAMAPVVEFLNTPLRGLLKAKDSRFLSDVNFF